MKIDAYLLSSSSSSFRDADHRLSRERFGSRSSNGSRLGDGLSSRLSSGLSSRLDDRLSSRSNSLI